MLAVAIDKKQIKKIAIAVLAVAALAAVIIVLGTKGSSGETPSGAEQIRGETAGEREAYLRALGLGFARSSTVSQVSVPEEWDERFTEYNEMLKAFGFDLTDLKGQNVSKCTYAVTSREDLGKNVFAVLLVKDGYIVAGHLITTDTGEFYPLTEPVETSSGGILE